MNDRQSISDHTLPRSERLRSLGAVRRLFTEGEGGFVYPFRYMYHVTKPRTECAGKADAAGVVPDHVDNSPGGRAEGSVEVLFSVPKKFHKRANRRNLLKRRTREAYRLSREALRRSVRETGVEIDVALVYSVKECQSYRSITYAVQRILERIRTRI